MSRSELRALKEQIAALEEQAAHMQEKVEEQEERARIEKLKTEGGVFYTLETEYLSSEPKVYTDFSDMLYDEFEERFEASESELIKLQVVPVPLNKEELESLKSYNASVREDDY